MLSGLRLVMTFMLRSSHYRVRHLLLFMLNSICYILCKVSNSGPPRHIKLSYIRHKSGKNEFAYFYFKVFMSCRNKKINNRVNSEIFLKPMRRNEKKQIVYYSKFYEYYCFFWAIARWIITKVINRS